jgi:hypothetical protein
MYWEQRKDTIKSFVKKAISENLFTSITQNTYFMDRITLDCHDKFWNVHLLASCSSTKAHIRQPENIPVALALIPSKIY